MRASHSSARSFQTRRSGASSRESDGSRPPRSGNRASRLLSTSLRNQVRSTCKARRRLSSFCRSSTSAGGRLMPWERPTTSRLVEGAVSREAPRVNTYQPMAVPARAERARASTTGQRPPSAPCSRASARLRRMDVGSAAGTGSAGLLSEGRSGAGRPAARGASTTVRSARAMGPVLSGIGKGSSAASTWAASAKRLSGSSSSKRSSTARNSGSSSS